MNKNIATVNAEEAIRKFHLLMQYGTFKVLRLTGAPKMGKSHLLKKVFPNIFKEKYRGNLYVYMDFNRKTKDVTAYLGIINAKLSSSSQFISYNEALAKIGSQPRVWMENITIQESKVNVEARGINWYANDYLTSASIADIREIENRILFLFDSVDELEQHTRTWLLDRFVPQLVNLDNVALVLAGRTLEGDYTSDYEEFSLNQNLSQVLNPQEYIAYLQQIGTNINLPETQIELLARAADYVPGLFTELISNIITNQC